LSRFTFETATPDDGQELLKILEDAPFKGNISLLYTRRPDAYRSFIHEAPRVDIVICRDQQQDKIVGFGACALRQLFVNGVPQTIGYLFGLRTRREYMRKFPLLHKAYAMIPMLHKDIDVPFYLTTILEENHYAQRLLEKRRASMPAYLPYGTYTVYTVFQRIRPKPPNLHPWRFRQAWPNDVQRLVNFISKNGCTSQFYPALQEQDLRSGVLPGLSIETFYLLVDEQDDILAAGAVWDQASYKQYVLQGYDGIFRLIAPASRIFPFFGFPALPAPRSVLRFFTLSFWAVKHQDPDIFRRFLQAISHAVSDYPFFLIGLHEQHPLRHIVEQRLHIRYASRLYLVSWDKEPHILQSLEPDRTPYLECGML
jgi:hypothetical protein